MTGAGSPPGSLFVVTYGRSGSTLVQGLLNRLPRTLVRGENRFFLLQLFRSYHHLSSHRETYNKPATRLPASAFYGLDEIDLDAFAADLRGLVNRQLLGEVDAGSVDRLGFKEVLWHRVRESEQEAFFGFLDLAFDRPLYVLNQRDVATTRESGFWQRTDPTVAEQQILRIQQMQEYLRATRGARCLDVTYERLTSSDPAVVSAELAALATFVTGACDAAVLADLRAVLALPHGPKPFGQSRQ